MRDGVGIMEAAGMLTWQKTGRRLLIFSVPMGNGISHVTSPGLQTSVVFVCALVPG